MKLIANQLDKLTSKNEETPAGKTIIDDCFYHTEDEKENPRHASMEAADATLKSGKAYASLFHPMDVQPITKKATNGPEKKLRVQEPDPESGSSEDSYEQKFPGIRPETKLTIRSESDDEKIPIPGIIRRRNEKLQSQENDKADGFVKYM